MSGERKAVIKNADMAEDMQQDAVECATQVKYCTIALLAVGEMCSRLFVSLIPHFTFTFFKYYDLVKNISK